jgi:hypothetical protein
MLMRAWTKRHDLLIGVYGLWLAVLTVYQFGWPWTW